MEEQIHQEAQAHHQDRAPDPEPCYQSCQSLDPAIVPLLPILDILTAPNIRSCLADDEVAGILKRGQTHLGLLVGPLHLSSSLDSDSHDA